jgi:peroxiredoxin Q/BCP
MIGTIISFFAGLLPVGTPAPDFTLFDQSGDSVHLAEWRGRAPVVLVFYPIDETSG